MSLYTYLYFCAVLLFSSLVACSSDLETSSHFHEQSSEVVQEQITLDLLLPCESPATEAYMRDPSSLWSYHSFGHMTTSIGHFGSHIVAHTHDGASGGASVFQSQAMHEPVSSFELLYQGIAHKADAASATYADVHAVVTVEEVDFTSFKKPFVYLMDSRGSLWSEPSMLPIDIGNTAQIHNAVSVSDDGQRIVANMRSYNGHQHHIFVYDRSSSQPIATYSLDTYSIHYHYGEMSADGSTFVLKSEHHNYVIDLDSGEILFFDDNESVINVVKVSVDGGTFLKPDGNFGVEVFRRSSNGTYASIFRFQGPEGYTSTMAGLSADGDTLVLATTEVFLGSPGSPTYESKIYVVDLSDSSPEPVLLYEATHPFNLGAGVKNVEFSPDGDVFGVVALGDGSEALGGDPELLVGKKASPTDVWHVTAYQLAGSATDLDIGVGGRMAIARRRAGTIYTFGQTAYESFDAQTRDLEINGYVGPGSTVVATMWGDPGEDGYLLLGSAVNHQNTAPSRQCSLAVDLQGADVLHAGEFNSFGELEFLLTIPHDATPGEVLHLQGVRIQQTSRNATRAVLRLPVGERLN